jgi:hypothetical protein
MCENQNLWNKKATICGHVQKVCLKHLRLFRTTYEFRQHLFLTYQVPTRCYMSEGLTFAPVLWSQFMKSILWSFSFRGTHLWLEMGTPGNWSFRQWISRSEPPDYRSPFTDCCTPVGWCCAGAVCVAGQRVELVSKTENVQTSRARCDSCLTFVKNES